MAVTVQQVFEELRRLAPVELACSWDNVGLLVDAGRPVTRIATALDITPAVVEEAAGRGCELIVAHHPVIFHPLRTLSAGDVPARLLAAGISGICMHTNLDAAEGGVNDTLAGILGIREAEPFAEGCGRIGRVEATSAEALARLCAARLGAHPQYVEADRPIRRLAEVSGAGGSYLEEALALGADCLVTGEAAHHVALAARAHGMGLVVAGHWGTEHPTAAVLTTYPDYSRMLEDYYATKDRAERLRQKSRELYKAVHNLYERSVRKQAARREELAQSEKADTLRLYGELLQANLWAFRKGDRQVTVDNYYTGQPVTIRLDPRLGPNENAQKYFKDYKKKQTAHAMLKKLLAEGEQEIDYLATVLYEVDAAPGEQALNEIRAELKSQGYLKYYKQRDKRQKPADFLRYRSSDGFEILVGRNNLQNDKLTLHTARGKDLWFHVQKAPGSHAVVLSHGQEIPDATREEAAGLAVLHSSQNGGAKVAVDTTEVRNIWKANGAKPGMVLYEVYTTVYVTPRPGLEEELRRNEADYRRQSGGR